MKSSDGPKSQPPSLKLHSFIKIFQNSFISLSAVHSQSNSH